jgi:putative flippase GtrA
MNAVRDLWHGSAVMRFIVVGCACAALYFAICLFLGAVLGASPFFASMGAYFICFWISYAAQREIAFRSTARHSVTLGRYFAWHAFCATAVSAATSAATQASDLAPLYTALVSTVLGGTASFVISSRWIFRNA